MFCRKCGKHIPDDSNYCQYCGEKVINTVKETASPQSEKKDSQDLWTLTDFAQEFGSMQILKAANKRGELLRYALFVKETRVDLNEQLQDADAAFIKQHKNELVVSKDMDNYVLSLSDLSKG